MPEITSTLQTEGAGNTGCALHPRSRVQNVHKNTHTSIQVQRKHSGIPCAMALRLISRSPRSVGLSCLRRLADMVLSARSGLTKPPRDLTPTAEASGPHDFAVRESTVRQRADRSLTETRPAIGTSARALPRPPQPVPTFVTMANAPLSGTGWRITSLIWVSDKQKYLCHGVKKDLT